MEVDLFVDDLKNPPRSLHHLVVLGDGVTFAVAGEHHPAIFVRLQNGNTQRLYGHMHGINCLVASNNKSSGHNNSGSNNSGSDDGGDTMLIASGSGDTTVKVWDVEAGSCLRSFHLHKNPVTALAWVSPTTLISGDSKGMVVVWDMEADSPRVFNGHKAKITAVEVIREDLIAVADESSNVILWTGAHNVNLNLGHSVTDHSVTALSHLTNAAGTEDGVVLVVAMGKSLHLFNSAGDDMQVVPIEFSFGRNPKWSVSELVPMADCNMYVAIDQFACDTDMDDRMLLRVVYDVKFGFSQELGFSASSAQTHDSIGAITSIAVSHDGAMLACGCEKKYVFHLDGATFNAITDAEGPFEGSVTKVALLADGYVCVTNHGEVFIKTSAHGTEDIVFPNRSSHTEIA